MIKYGINKDVFSNVSDSVPKYSYKIHSCKKVSIAVEMDLLGAVFPIPTQVPYTALPIAI